MAVQRVKRRAVSAVLQNDGRAVVEMGVVVAVAVDETVKRCVYRRTGRQKQVDADVNGAPFRKFVGVLREGIVAYARRGSS